MVYSTGLFFIKETVQNIPKLKVTKCQAICDSVCFTVQQLYMYYSHYGSIYDHSFFIHLVLLYDLISTRNC